MLIHEHPGHRARVIRTALLYTPLGMFTVGVTSWLALSLLGGNLGALFGFAIMGLVTFAVMFEAIASLRDLVAVPVKSRGEIRRRWSKGRFLFIGTVNYILVERRVFEVAGQAFGSIEEGDVVELEHWPHTNVVASIYLVTDDPDATYRSPGA